MSEVFETWAIVEIMGHRKLAGRVLTPGGPGALANMIRLDVYSGNDEDNTTQFYNSSSIFSLTPTTEEAARRFAEGLYREIRPYELPAGTSGLEELP